MIVLLGVVPGISLYVATGPWREAKREKREILTTGQAAVATIVSIDEIAQGRGGTTYAVTLEFARSGFGEPVRAQIQLSSRDVDKLGVYQQVPIHYSDQIPIAAVIDQLVK